MSTAGTTLPEWSLFLDDERDISYVGLTVEDGVVACRSSAEAMIMCRTHGRPPSVMYLDHDLGYLPGTYEPDTTMLFLRWATNEYPDWDFSFSVHSQNPTGVQNIIAFLNSFRRSQSLP